MIKQKPENPVPVSASLSTLSRAFWDCGYGASGAGHNVTPYENILFKDIRKVDSLQIKSKTGVVSSVSPGFLFQEKGKNGFVSRFTAGVSLAGLHGAFEDDDWRILAHSDGNIRGYSATGKTKKTITALDGELFALLD